MVVEHLGVGGGTIMLGDYHRCDEFKKEVDALRARVAEMEQQEPVAWAATDETCRIVEALSFNQSRRFDTPLYALPGAKGE